MWHYQSRPFTSADIGDYKTFVYLLTDTVTGIRYVGMKNFHSTITKPPLKGQKRKRKVTSESDWATYVGSNETFKGIAKDHGITRFHREILHLCHSRQEAAYLEMLEQIGRQVLFRDDYANGIVQVRINANHVKKYANRLKTTICGF